MAGEHVTRLLLATVALAVVVTAGATVLPVGAQEGPESPETFAVTQGEACVEITPLGDGSRTVSAFYDYEGRPAYASRGTRDLQIADVSQFFVYRGSDGLSLVVLNDRLGDGTHGGAATFFFNGLPESGEWAVEDDDFPESDDEFDHQGSRSRIFWVWGNGSSDGAAFRGLGSEASEEITINPTFSDDARDITAWGVRDADGTVYRLDMDEPVTVRPGSCDGSAPPTTQPSTAHPTTEPPDTTPTESPGPVSVVDISTNRSTVRVGEDVLVTATVENTGERARTYTASLATLGRVVGQTEVTVPPGESTTVTFSHSFDAPGTYALVVGGQRTQVHVDAVPGTPGTARTATDGSGLGAGPALAALVVVGLTLRRRRW